MLIAQLRVCSAIEELSLPSETSRKAQGLKGSELKHLDATKEPNVFSFRNLLLYYPGCISADEDGNRLFLSDTNHHRIIIFDGKGKILDCVCKVLLLISNNHC
ncbi:Nhl domain-containing protein [Thalictrum thalictroides]|uniref:Nhl domain-containing protein n=1 Tax=Thalictrum thalictroides TaxID=46969 RepID=A0A7J6WNT7_THATH|nr:Nhl domain-containing protein [Thalictrum thalictroides]